MSWSLCALSAVQAQTSGSQDPTFASGPEADNTVLALALQPNGQVLAGGLFSQFRGQPRNCLARLNPDGSLDSFDPGPALTGYTDSRFRPGDANNGVPKVYALAVQPDGKVIVGGNFSVLNQTPGGGLARLNADGSLDSTFNAGSGAVYGEFSQVGQVNCLAVLPNGKILVGGTFESFNNVSPPGLVRLNADGSVDTTFNPGGGGLNGNVRSIAVQSNGQIVIGGNFVLSNSGLSDSCIARLNADGTLDQSFSVEFGPDLNIYAVAVQSNGQVIVGGNFNSFDDSGAPNHLLRLNTNGSVDASYLGSHFNLSISEVDSIVVQPDDKAIIGGAFIRERGGQAESPHNGVARILTSGMQDTTFDSGDGSDAGQALALVLQPDGRVIEASDLGSGAGDQGDVFRLYAPITPVVSIATGVAQTGENSGTPATFVLTLSSAPLADIRVAYKIKGSGENGVDFDYLTGKVKVKAGKLTKKILVTPIDRGIGGGGKVTVKLVLSPGTGYTTGSPNLAKVKIIDGD